MSESAVTRARQALAQLQRDAEVARDRAAAASGVAPADRFVVAVVPRHRARLQRLAASRRRAFSARLRELVATVRATAAADDERTLDHPEPLSGDAVALVVATCSACGGKCCGNGGTHAFLRTRTVREFMTAHPSLGDDEVVAAYEAYLPERAAFPGCVFQGRAGCTLPRTMRSAICNAYLCGGLQQVLATAAARARAGETTAGVYVAFREGHTLSGGRLRALPVLEP